MKKTESFFDLVPGLKPVDPESLVEYEKAIHEAIPQIIENVRERQKLAAEARARLL